MKMSIKKIVNVLVEWIVRRRSPALAIARIGLSLAVLGFAGELALDLAIPSAQGPITVRITQDGTIELAISNIVGSLGIILILWGAAWEWIRYWREERRIDKKRVIALEVRGLRDTSGSPLAEALPSAIEGQRDSLLVDLRQVRDGVIVDPAEAIAELATLPKELQRRSAGGSRGDISIVYAGLAPVPLTFLTGVLLDDEGAVTVMDWDRFRNCWRSLDGDDDGLRFDVEGLQQVPIGTSSVALAVSVSYEVDLARISGVVSDIPVVEMRLREGSTDAHWSEEKQRELGKQFLDTVISIGNIGVSEIHLFLAAQNSIVFSFGRLYDKRNLPRLTVYQYQKDHGVAFPWGIRMPVMGLSAAEVVRIAPST